jgi:hypothetical protein
MSRRVFFLAAIFAGVAGIPVSGQWLNYPAAGAPRTKDGKVNVSARAPRTPWGKPDLSGVWHVEATPIAEMKRLFGENINQIEVPGMEIGTQSKYAFNIFLDFKPGEIPMRPEAAELQRQHLRRAAAAGTNCEPYGFPVATLLSEVTKIVQTPGLTIMMLELDNTYRQIYTDGRKLPVEPNPSWLGYSVGRWMGDTLAVETNGFNDRAWLDVIGHPRSEAMRMTERYRRRDFGHMDVEITFDDPKMYTKPFTIKTTHLLEADSDILEYFCIENEKDRAHIQGN